MVSLKGLGSSAALFHLGVLWRLYDAQELKPDLKLTSDNKHTNLITIPGCLALSQCEAPLARDFACTVADPLQRSLLKWYRKWEVSEYAKTNFECDLTRARTSERPAVLYFQTSPQWHQDLRSLVESKRRLELEQQYRLIDLAYVLTDKVLRQDNLIQDILERVAVSPNRFFYLPFPIPRPTENDAGPVIMADIVKSARKAYPAA
jgi:hypothetical protein